MTDHPTDPPAVWGAPVARGAALFFGGFGILNALGGLLRPGFDANPWWIDFRPVDARLVYVGLILASLALVAYAVRPAMRPRRRILTLSTILILAAFAAANAARFWILLSAGSFHTTLPVPLSLPIALVLLGIAVAVWRQRPGAAVPEAATAGRRRRTACATMAVTVLACLILFSLAQMYFFGKSDYRRSADAIVVLGARAYRDGTPSGVLADRVNTACDLYQQGLAPRLIFSGGPVAADVAFDEPDVMRRLALSRGVPPEVIILDHGGVNTRATVADTCPLLESLHARRVLVVSHFYHLPRIKLAYQRRGREVLTVPARESGLPSSMSWQIGREALALWVYYLWPGSR